ncbi:dihydrofolate reductase domain-containing protein [Sarocladium implicatum]|nr:dihydrofolate reductase domain-containing protein [Sarocladium implicatum]
MQPELTLIVAATRSMGIGLNGSMPWKGLRKEMQYFARVTSRVPTEAPAGSMNAVIMGRKTWDSIPPKFRPLKDRLNIVITRSAPPSLPSHPVPATEPVRVSSLEQALKFAQGQGSTVGRVFVIGGAQIYEAALRLPEARRVLITCIERDFECDTFFPDLKEGWERRSKEEQMAWTGEEREVVEGEHEEAGTKYEFQMWERKD